MSRETVIFIIPTYNEESVIRKNVISWIPVIKSIPGSMMLIVNDGSTDNTDNSLNKLQKEFKFLKVINKKNEGHGRTIRLGYEHATKSKYTWIFQTDSDGHFTPSDFYKLWDMRNTSPFILGHREKRADTFFRRALTKIIKGWVFILFRTVIYDPNIPFRLMKVSYLKKILPKVKSGVFAPNIHLSILAARDKHNLHHIPVEHKNLNKKHNNINIFKGAFQGFFELLFFAFEIA